MKYFISLLFCCLKMFNLQNSGSGIRQEVSVNFAGDIEVV